MAAFFVKIPLSVFLYAFNEFLWNRKAGYDIIFLYLYSCLKYDRKGGCNTEIIKL